MDSPFKEIPSLPGHHLSGPLTSAEGRKHQRIGRSVQSDHNRMDWFRGLLAEKARSFQIVVFTCRPSDYLAATSMVPAGSGFHTDTDNGFIRGIDLERARPRK